MQGKGFLELGVTWDLSYLHEEMLMDWDLMDLTKKSLGEQVHPGESILKNKLRSRVIGQHQTKKPKVN